MLTQNYVTISWYGITRPQWVNELTEFKTCWILWDPVVLSMILIILLHPCIKCIYFNWWTRSFYVHTKYLADTVKTFCALPDRKSFFYNFKHGYIKKFYWSSHIFYWSSHFFISRGPRTDKFRGVCLARTSKDTIYVYRWNFKSPKILRSHACFWNALMCVSRVLSCPCCSNVVVISMLPRVVPQQRGWLPWWSVGHVTLTSSCKAYWIRSRLQSKFCWSAITFIFLFEKNVMNEVGETEF